jgi:aminotransferase EvaB
VLILQKTFFACGSMGGPGSIAMLRAMLPMLDQWNSRRREIAARYTRNISHPSVVTPRLRAEEYVAHLYVVQAGKRNDLQEHLARVGIPTETHYPVPDYRQPAFRHLHGIERPVTSQACDEVLTLPCFPEMLNEEVDMVSDRINAW